MKKGDPSLFEFREQLFNGSPVVLKLDTDIVQVILYAFQGIPYPRLCVLLDLVFRVGVDDIREEFIETLSKRVEIGFEICANDPLET